MREKSVKTSVKNPNDLGDPSPANRTLLTILSHLLVATQTHTEVPTIVCDLLFISLNIAHC